VVLTAVSHQAESGVDLRRRRDIVAGRRVKPESFDTAERLKNTGAVRGSIGHGSTIENKSASLI
jgi:hypothetical protein